MVVPVHLRNPHWISATSCNSRFRHRDLDAIQETNKRPPKRFLFLPHIWETIPESLLIEKSRFRFPQSGLRFFNKDFWHKGLYTILKKWSWPPPQCVFFPQFGPKTEPGAVFTKKFFIEFPQSASRFLNQDFCTAWSSHSLKVFSWAPRFFLSHFGPKNDSIFFVNTIFSNRVRTPVSKSWSQTEIKTF